MEKSPEILIVGAGRIGQAFSYILKESGATVEMCDSDEAKCPAQLPLEKTVPTADGIILCIPSWVTRDFLLSIKPLLRPETIIITVAKGIEKSTLRTLDEIIADAIPDHARWGIIIGPMLAEEITQGQGSAGVLASHAPEIFDLVQQWIPARHLRLEYSPDVHGAALCGVLKNVYALGLGVSDGLGWGANRKGWLMTHAIREMRSIVALLGGDPETVDSPAGLGDLVATSTSPFSRNRATGDKLVQTGELNPLSEGAVSCESLRALVGHHAREFVFLPVILSVALDGRSAAEAYEEFLNHA